METALTLWGFLSLPLGCLLFQNLTSCQIWRNRGHNLVPSLERTQFAVECPPFQSACSSTPAPHLGTRIFAELPSIPYAWIHLKSYFFKVLLGPSFAPSPSDFCSFITSFLLNQDNIFKFHFGFRKTPFLPSFQNLTSLKQKPESLVDFCFLTCNIPPLKQQRQGDHQLGWEGEVYKKSKNTGKYLKYYLATRVFFSVSKMPCLYNFALSLSSHRLL